MSDPSLSNRLTTLVFAAVMFIAPFGSARAQLLVHEWGTMTTVHEPGGRALAKLNLIEQADVLPDFVHRFEPRQPEFLPFAPFAKSARTPGRPDVTMRLETPVLYFYDPGNTVANRAFDVHVQMRGGVLNEFFPIARPGLQRDGVEQRGVQQRVRLDSSWSGTLSWTNVTLDEDVAVPNTNASVWLAPRAVRANKLRIANEAEHYLFYRGVANLDALLSTQHTRELVTLRNPSDVTWMRNATTSIPRVWLVDVRANGTLAFATRARVFISSHPNASPVAQFERFTSSDFGSDRMTALWRSMTSELVAAGLYADEAEAMLNTWQASYFRKPGLRVFYMVPREWTEHYLPLELSVPHQGTRVLIGRIDLVTTAETT